MASAIHEEVVGGNNEYDEDLDKSESHCNVEEQKPISQNALDTIATMSLHYPDW